MKVVYQLWLSIIGISHITLSMNMSYIKSSLNQLFNNFNYKYNSSPVKQNPASQQTQLDKIRKKNTIKVAITDDKAYWVQDNIFYESDIVDGCIDSESSKPIDAHKLSSKELNKLLDILDGIHSS